MKRMILVASLVLALAGCSMLGTAAKVAQHPVGQPTLTDLRNKVYAAKLGYEAALTVAVQYNALPRCGRPTSPPICSSADLVVQLRKADAAASTTLDAAENIVRGTNPDTSVASAAISAAEQAVAALTVAVAKTKS